jgi:hypothetical protein
MAVPGARAATLEERLRTPFAVTANGDASGSNPLPLAKEVATVEQILPAWSELHALLPEMTARANLERSLGLKVAIGFSPTSIAGLRTEIDLPPWVAAGCGLSTATASFSNPCLQAFFIADATTVAAAVQPDYFHLATEVNTLLLRKIAAPADQEFAFFGLLYRTAHDRVLRTGRTNRTLFSGITLVAFCAKCTVETCGTGKTDAPYIHLQYLT